MHNPGLTNLLQDWGFPNNLNLSNHILQIGKIFLIDRSYESRLKIRKSLKEGFSVIHFGL